MRKNKSNTETRGPGRPQYKLRFPSGKFTFNDLMIHNGVNPKTGKGKLASKLTLTKNLERDMYILNEDHERTRVNPHSTIVLLKGVLAEPNSKSGLGRKQLVYIRRSKLNGKETATAPVAATPRKTRKAASVTVDVSTSNYEATKAALLAPTPAVVITPAPEIVSVPADSVPAVELTAPAPEETPAPEAVAAEVAAVADTATAEAALVPAVDTLVNS